MTRTMIRLVILLALASLVISCSQKTIRFSPYEIQEFEPEIQEHIRNGEIALGMSPQAVRYSWGAPNLIRVRETKDGTYKEEWIYTKLRIYATRLIFTEAKLTGIISGAAKRKPPSLMGLGKKSKSAGSADQGQQQKEETRTR